MDEHPRLPKGTRCTSFCFSTIQIRALLLGRESKQTPADMRQTPRAHHHLTISDIPCQPESSRETRPDQGELHMWMMLTDTTADSCWQCSDAGYSPQTSNSYPIRFCPIYITLSRWLGGKQLRPCHLADTYYTLPGGFTHPYSNTTSSLMGIEMRCQDRRILLPSLLLLILMIGGVQATMKLCGRKLPETLSKLCVYGFNAMTKRTLGRWDFSWYKEY